MTADDRTMLLWRTRVQLAWDMLRGRDPAMPLIASLRASLDDARAEVTRLSAQAKRRNDLTRDAAALLATAITDDGVPQP